MAAAFDRRQRYTRIVDHPVITIDDSAAPPARLRHPGIHSRRLAIAGGLALAEVVTYLAFDPSRWLAVVLVGTLLAACIALSGRLAPGLGRDLMVIAGIAQAMVIALPLLLGFLQLVLAAVLVVVIITLFITVGLRFRR